MSLVPPSLVMLQEGGNLRLKQAGHPCREQVVVFTFRRSVVHFVIQL